MCTSIGVRTAKLRTQCRIFHDVEFTSDDCQAAFAAATWLQRADLDGSLSQFLNPPLEPVERQVAAIEGWTLGVV